MNPYLDMSQDMTLAILRKSHSKDRSDGEVDGSGFEDWPFGDGETLDEDEALPVNDFFSDR